MRYLFQGLEYFNWIQIWVFSPTGQSVTVDFFFLSHSWLDRQVRLGSILHRDIHIYNFSVFL